MERLWSPWRLAYVTGASRRRQARLHLLRRRRRTRRATTSSSSAAALAYVILNLYPYNNGHLMVVPNRHVADRWRRRRADELAELMRLTRHAEIALTEAYTPQASTSASTSAAPAGAGIARSSARPPGAALERRHQLHVGVGDTRVLPEELTQTAARLRPIFERLANDDVVTHEARRATKTRRLLFVFVSSCLRG